MRFRELFQRPKSFSFSGFGGGGLGYGYGFGMVRELPGSQYDYRREVGIAWENSVVLMGINWMFESFSEAPLIIQERKSDGSWSTLLDHPALELIQNPTTVPLYDENTINAGMVLSRIVDGNAYWYVDVSAGKKPVGLYYMPHYMVTPRWGVGGGSYIDYYEYKPDGKSIKIEPEQVVHFRTGIDPLNTRKGLSKLGAAVREICTINETSTASAAMMRNFGIPGMMVSPKPGTAIDQVFDNETEKKLRRLAETKISGERRGEPIVWPIPVDVTQLGFAPDKLAFDKVFSLAASVVCGSMNIDPMVLGLPSTNKTYANFEEANRAAYRQCMVPLWRQSATSLTRQLLHPWYDPQRRLRFMFDLTQVKSIQQDNALLMQALAIVNFMTDNEKRNFFNLPAIDGGDELNGSQVSINSANAGNGGEQDEDETDPQDADNTESEDDDE